MSEQTNKDTVRKGYQAFDRQDIPALMELFDEHIAWTEPEWTYGVRAVGTVYGRDEVLHQVFEPITQYYDSFELEPRHYYADADAVVAEGSFRLRPKGVDELLEVPFTHIWRFHDGKVVSMHAYLDVAQLYERRELRRAA